jgi:DNA-binding GntR family transcriptional regulator
MPAPVGSGKSASAHDALKDQAIKGRLRPGRHLAPVDLASRFRISITPIRDALVRLAEEGFLTWTASRGYFTKAFSVEEQRDLFSLLNFSVLAAASDGPDGAAVSALQALRAVPEDPRLESAATTAAAAEAWAGHVERLGLEVVAATGNRVALVQMRNYQERTYLVRRLDYLDPEVRREAAQCLRHTAEALLSKDLTLAFEVSGRRLAAQTGRLPQLVALANSQALQADFP